MAHLVGLLVGLAQGWLDRHHRPGCRQLLGNQSDHQHAHLADLLVGLAQGWLDRHHRPA
ncbi:hypothetical protein ACET9O_14625 [Aeromonas caviae]|uniref:hypothetical protein n=1 Tax=Aeromonas caviae TaxID=648 RepID=UPI000B17BEBC|nr:hypothetical protein [Aeromonas caviae]MCR9023993.1 hypothetical protein [Aeromonas caviae]